MRLTNLDGRAVLLAAGTTALDVAMASGPGLPARYDAWEAFLAHEPQPRLRSGQTLRNRVEGIGELRQTVASRIIIARMAAFRRKSGATGVGYGVARRRRQRQPPPATQAIQPRWESPPRWCHRTSLPGTPCSSPLAPDHPLADIRPPGLPGTDRLKGAP